MTRRLLRFLKGLFDGGETILIRRRPQCLHVVCMTLAALSISITVVLADTGIPATASGPPENPLSENWAQVQSPTTERLEGVAMTSATEGWAVGRNGTILRYHNGQWLVYSSPTAQHLRGIDMVSSELGWIVGDYGTVLQYDGGGWQVVSVPTGQDLHVLDAISQSDVWIGGYAALLHLSLSGWQASHVPWSVYGIRMLSSSEGWLVGSWGDIAHFSDGSWSAVSSPTNAELLGLDMVSAIEGWVAGWDYFGNGKGVILHLGPTGWQMVYCPTDAGLWDVDMLSSNDGWAVGEEGAILHKDHSGWQVVSSPTNATLLSVHMLSSNDGWAVGDQGTILHYTAPPQEWVFTGHVYEGNLGETDKPLAGVRVTLTGTNDPVVLGTELDVTYTGPDGYFFLRTSQSFSYLSLSELDPPGYQSVGASAGPGGWIRAPNWIQFDLPESGTYSGNAFWDTPVSPPTPTPSVTPTHTATPTATPTSTPCTDPYEPDDAWYEAKTIIIESDWQHHLHQTPGDVDYVKFTVATGQGYLIRTDFLGGGLANDTTLTLYDTDGIAPLAYNDEDPLNPPASRIEWICPADGTYFVKAAQFNPAVGGCEFSYSLNISFLPATATPTSTATATSTATPTATSTAIPDTGRIVGLVYADLNGNGYPDPDEPPLPDVIITVQRVDGTGATRVTTTRQDGRYEVGNLQIGLHRVEETDPKWYYSLSPNIVVVMMQPKVTVEVDFADYPMERALVPLILKQ